MNRSRDGKTLLGVRGEFNSKWLDADCDALIEAQRAWLDHLSFPTGISPETALALRAACTQIKTQIYSPEDKIKSFWTTPGRWPHRHMWLWDSVFHAAGLRRLEPEIAWDALEAVLNARQEDGFISLTVSPVHPRAKYTQPPIPGLGMSLVYERQNDLERLERCFWRNAGFLKWIFNNRDRNHDGLAEWLIADESFCRCGESGMDNSSRFDAAEPMDAVDFNAYLAHECELMARFSELLGLPEQQEFWRAHHLRINKLINEKLWNDEKGFYFDYNITNSRQSDVCASA